MRLLVTGCPRSGNTLLSLLVAWGFEGWTRLPEEGFPFPKNGEKIVGKRLSVASAVPELLEYDLHLRVVWMIRDPRDACVSVHPASPAKRPMVTPEMWIERAKIALLLRLHPRVWILRYEDLVRMPNEVQGKLASWLDIPVTQRWSEWDGSGIEEAKEKKNFLALSGVRPVEASRIGSHLRSEGAKATANALLKNDGVARLAGEFQYELRGATS